uniref:Uncharacterized protein n=1 Tax=Anguilla anguilla TaxID=7936 RepID=A0A0E9WAM4_ANGAN
MKINHVLHRKSITENHRPSPNIIKQICYCYDCTSNLANRLRKTPGI